MRTGRSDDMDSKCSGDSHVVPVVRVPILNLYESSEGGVEEWWVPRDRGAPYAEFVPSEDRCCHA